MGSARRKLGIVTASSSSSWISCVSISDNLRRAYQKWAERDHLTVEWFSSSADLPGFKKLKSMQGFEMAKQIGRARLTDLIFLDHHVDPGPVLGALQLILGPDFGGLRFAFHVYGDFTLFPERWLSLGRQTQGFPAKWICASDRQKAMVSYFEPAGRSISEICPFPVHAQTFQFSESLRSATRKSLGLRSRDKLLLYTGRLSLQKGLIPLVEEFKRLCEHGSHSVHLAIAGGFDDIGGLTSGLTLPPGYFAYKLSEQLRELPPAIRNRIHLVGSVDAKELRKLYSAADLFVSFSLHHDEDYGMSPAEALCTGLPCLLTDWAGYASFAVPYAPCELTPVRLSARGLEFDRAHLRSRLKSMLERDFSAARRLKDGKAFAARFGVDGVATRLREILRPESFNLAAGFTWHLDSYIRSRPLKGGLYTEIYGNYVRGKSH